MISCPHIWYAIIMDIASDAINNQNNFIPKRYESSLFLLPNRTKPIISRKMANIVWLLPFMKDKNGNCMPECATTRTE